MSRQEFNLSELSAAPAQAAKSEYDLGELTAAPTYDTPLTPKEEKSFQSWKAKYAPKDSGDDYDLRGAFKAGLTPDPTTGHWPDTFKKPNHPTFSVESIYATGDDLSKAGHWEGPQHDQFVAPGARKTAVRPARLIDINKAKDIRDELELDRHLRQNPTISAIPTFGETAADLQEPISKKILGVSASEAVDKVLPENPSAVFEQMMTDPETGIQSPMPTGVRELVRRSAKMGAGILDWIQSPEALAIAALEAATGGAATPVVGRLLGAQFTTQGGKAAVKHLDDIRKNGFTPENTEGFLTGMTMAVSGAAGIEGLRTAEKAKAKTEAESKSRAADLPKIVAEEKRIRAENARSIAKAAQEKLDNAAAEKASGAATPPAPVEKAVEPVETPATTENAPEVPPSTDQLELPVDDLTVGPVATETPAGAPPASQDGVTPVPAAEELPTAQPEAALPPLMTEAERLKENPIRAKEPETIRNSEFSNYAAQVRSLAERNLPSLLPDIDAAIALHDEGKTGDALVKLEVARQELHGAGKKLAEAAAKKAGIELPSDETPRETPRARIEGAETGKPFSAKLVRGEGREGTPYNPLGAQVPILGEGRYTTNNDDFARQFGDNLTLHEVKLKNPLVIDSDAQWRQLTQQAGWKFPNPFGTDPKIVEKNIAALRKMIVEDGHDGVIIRVPESETIGKTLQKVFDSDQVVEFNVKKKKAAAEPIVEAQPATPRERLIWDGAETEMQAWAEIVREVQNQLKRGDSAMTMESNAQGKEIEEGINRKANSIRSLGVKEGSPLHDFSETPEELASAIEDKGGRLKDSKKAALYARIQKRYREMYEETYGPAIDDHLAKATDTQKRELFGPDAPHEFEEGATPSSLGRTEEEGMTKLAGGRPDEQLREAKIFDETGLVNSELFGGRGGAQQFLGSDDRGAPESDLAGGEGEGDVSFPRAGPRPQLPNAPAATVPPGTLIAKSQILRELSKRLGIPLRVGRFRMAGALGIFKVRAEVARTKIANDVAVASHEFGHAINKIMYGVGSGKGLSLNWRPFAPFRSELAAIATKPRAGQSPLPEGFAEYVRMFLTDPAQATMKAPKFDAFFKGELQRFPELRDTLETAQKDIRRWIQQPAMAKVLSAISMKDVAPAPDRWKSFYTNIIDKLEPVRAAEEEMLKGSSLATSKSPYALARLFAGWAGKADHFLQHGTFDPETNAISGPGLKEILKPVDGDLMNFRGYLVAGRVIEKSRQGIETGIDIASARAAFAQADTQLFRDTAAKLYVYQSELLEYLVSSKMMSPELALRMRHMNQWYVPFYRAFEADAGPHGPGVAGAGFGNVADALKKMYGSGRDIIDPLESIVKNTYTMINLAERNKVALALADLGNKTHGAGKFIEKVPPKMQATKFELERIKNDLIAAGIDVDQADLSTIATIFNPINEMGGKDNILSVVRNGNREFYQTEPTLYRALQGLDDAGSHLLIRLLSVPAHLLRAGATALSPEFAVRNPVRDAFTAFMQSEYGFRPGIDTVRGILHAVKRDDLYQEWRRSGGEHAAMVSLDRTSLKQHLDDLVSSPVKWTVHHPLEALRMLSEFTEAGTRLGEYQRAREKGASPSTAALASRDVSVDFARHGASTRALNSIVAFWNANVQGMDQFIRLHKQFPVRSMVRGAAGLTVPSLILYAVNRNNEKYKELPRWRRDLFWNIPTDGTPLNKYTPFIAIPKPFEWGMIYSTAAERIAEFVDTRDSSAFDEYAKNLLDVATPGIVPTAAIPPIEYFANRSLFTGRPIVPAHLERFSPEFRYQFYTSEFSKLMAKSAASVGMHFSPMQLDNAIYGYTGGFGRLVADMTNPPLRALTGSPAPPAGTVADIPVVRGFAVRYPGSTESEQKFYNLLNDLDQKRNTITAAKKGQISDNPVPMTAAENRAYAILNAENGAIQKLRFTQRQIVANDSLSREDKRRQIDAIDLEVTGRMKAALGRASGR